MRLLMMLFPLFLLGVEADRGSGIQDPSERLKGLASTVQQLLLDTTKKRSEIDQKILEVADPFFDFPLMARLSLGTAQWSKLKKEEQEQFLAKFRKQLEEIYLDRAHQNSEAKVTISPSRSVAKGRMEVDTTVHATSGNISVLYRFHELKPDEWRIYDVEVAGVSLIRSYRAQYGEVFDREGFKGVMARLGNGPATTPAK